MTLKMFDAVTVGNLPDGADAYAGYVDGMYDNIAAIRARFPHAHVFGYAVTASDDGDGLDVENGDATPEQVPDWVKRQLARGVWRPVVYGSSSICPQIISLLTAAGVARSEYRLISAHYEGSVGHICGRADLGPACQYQNFQPDGTQWIDHGGTDENLLVDDFFTPAVTPSVPEDDDMAILVQIPGDVREWCLSAAGFFYVSGVAQRSDLVRCGILKSATPTPIGKDTLQDVPNLRPDLAKP